MTGIRAQRLRRVAAVAVLACLLSSIPAAAWAGDDHGRSGHRSERSASHDRHDEPRHKHDRSPSQKCQHPGGSKSKADRASGKPHAMAKQAGHHDRAREDTGRDRNRPSAKPKARGPKRDGQADRTASKQTDRDGFVTAASVDSDRDTEVARDDRDRKSADQTQRQREAVRTERREATGRERREAEARAQRFRAWLERIDAPAPQPQVPTDAAVEVEMPQTPTADPEAQPPADEDEDVVAGVTGAPSAPPAPATEAVASTEPSPTTQAAAGPSADVLAHERGVVDRTFRAGTELLRDTGRAVVQALPPQSRTFGLPLGLLAGLGGYLVVQRRFRFGQLPMSAAAVPMQESARERHRL